MAVTTTDSNLQAKIYSKYVVNEGLKNTFFGKFSSTSGDSIVNIYKDLVNLKGGSIRIPKLAALANAPIDGDTVLYTSAESIAQDYMDVTIGQKRFPVARGRLANQQAPWEYGEEAKVLLRDAWTNYFDDTITDLLTTAPTTAETIYAASTTGTYATAISEITSTHYLTANLAWKAKITAQLRSIKIEPIMVEGQPRYIMLCHPAALRDLFQQDSGFANSVLYGYERGASSNPIITGAYAIYHGIIFYEYERIKRTTSGASSANVCKNLLLGKNALIHATCQDYTIDVETYDVGNITYYVGRWMGGFAKTKFTSQAADFACIQVLTGGA